MDISATLSATAVLSGSESLTEPISATLTPTSTLAAELATESSLAADLSDTAGLAGEITVPSTVGDTSYTGGYTVTPTQETQTLSTANKTLTHNIVVNPIPSNYGLITWDGSVLTVS